MFKKIIIAEDHDTNHPGIEEIVKEYSPVIEKVKYCDDALPKLLASLKNDTPFEVLITDLRFDEDHTRKRTITCGEDLVVAARELIPELKVIVHSVEKGVARVHNLYEKYHINAFVEKGRQASKHIRKALEMVARGHSYCSPQMEQLLRSSKEIEELNEKDVELLDLLIKGLKQKDIAEHFNCSVSNIEKRLNRLKIIFNANTSIQLISIAKDWGVV